MGQSASVIRHRRREWQRRRRARARACPTKRVHERSMRVQGRRSAYSSEIVSRTIHEGRVRACGTSIEVATPVSFSSDASGITAIALAGSRLGVGFAAADVPGNASNEGSMRRGGLHVVREDDDMALIMLMFCKKMLNSDTGKTVSDA